MQLGNLEAGRSGHDIGLLREYDVQFLELAERLLRDAGQNHKLQPISKRNRQHDMVRRLKVMADWRCGQGTRRGMSGTKRMTSHQGAGRTPTSMSDI